MIMLPVAARHDTLYWHCRWRAHGPGWLGSGLKRALLAEMNRLLRRKLMPANSPEVLRREPRQRLAMRRALRWRWRCVPLSNSAIVRAVGASRYYHITQGHAGYLTIDQFVCAAFDAACLRAPPPSLEV
jgi:hypothetical protein